MKAKGKKIGLRIMIVFFAVILICVGIIHLTFFPLLRNPHTNLEFWIGQRVESEDFSEHEFKPGLWGGDEYYGTGYIPTLDEHNQQVDPEHCVIYRIQNYPDVTSPNLYVTNIYITDPEVEIYGININSSPEEFKNAMKKNGFSLTEHFTRDGKVYKAKMGRCTICFEQEKYIEIDLDGTNILGIVF